MVKKVLFAVILGIFILAFYQVVNVSAQEKTPVTDDQVNEVASQLYCPVCENVSLDVCPTQACTQWRDLIREKLEAGWTTEQIKTYFAEQYGDRVLPSPPKRGINWLVYILPPAMIIGGAILLGWIIISLLSPKSGKVAQGEAAPEKDVYISRVEDELKKRKG